MKQIPKISESEWQVMKVLWKASPLTANNVVNSLAKNTLWAPKTIKTLLNRLVQKEALRFEKKGREYLYYPNFGADECIKEETHSFLQRVTDGAIKPMLAAFLEDHNLSMEEFEELKQMLNEKEVKENGYS